MKAPKVDRIDKLQDLAVNVFAIVFTSALCIIVGGAVAFTIALAFF